MDVDVRTLQLGAVRFLRHAQFDDFIFLIVAFVVLVQLTRRYLTEKSKGSPLEFFFHVPQASIEQVKSREERADTRNISRAFREWVRACYMLIPVDDV